MEKDKERGGKGLVKVGATITSRVVVGLQIDSPWYLAFGLLLWV